MAQRADGDVILLQGMVFHAFHGVLPAEQVLGQKFKVDATLYCGRDGLKAAAHSDDVADTVSYADCFETVRFQMMRAKRHLIESVADDISTDLLQQHAMVDAVRVRITKPHVCVDGHFTGMGIEVFRRRNAGWGK